MTRYINIKSSLDLHLLDRVRNHDKVYHLAVFERDDGGHDVLYRYGRRGSTLRLGILKGEENLRDYQTAIRLMNRKEAAQVRGDGYQYADGITPNVWKDLLVTSTKTPVSQPSTPPESEVPAPAIGGNGPKSWFW